MLQTDSYSTIYHDVLLMDDLLDNINDVLITTDSDFIITNWNKAAERMYGIPASEAIGANRTELLQYEFLDSDIPDIIQQLKTFNKWKGIAKFIKADSSEVYFESSASVIRNKAGDITGYVSIQRDITQQYLSGQSLQNFTAILHFLEESFLIIDRNWKVVFLSPKKNVQDFHKSDYKIGDDALKFISPAHKEDVIRNYRKAFRGEIISHEAESDGIAEPKMYLHVTYMPVKNSYGNVTHVAVIIKDLTEEKRLAFVEQKKKEAEEQLYQSRKLFEDFMENCPLPSWVTDEEGKMQYMSPTYLKDIHLSKDDIGKNIHVLFPKTVADEFYRNNMTVLADNKASTVIEHSIAANGSDITFLITKFPLYYQEQRMIGGWAIDITEQINIQQQLEETSQFKDKILTVIAHDLRSPLTVISSIGNLINDDTDPLPKEEFCELIQGIQSCNDKALALLGELILWGQGKMNAVRYLPQQTEISTAIFTSTGFLKDRLQAKYITVHYDLQPDIFADADADMLKTIVRNLVSNAIKFSPLHSTITITASLSEKQLLISISDEGCGINDDLKDRILKGTNTTSAYGTDGESGIGIGLNICRDFIKINKGILFIRNNDTKGVTFSFSLPVFDASTKAMIAS